MVLDWVLGKKSGKSKSKEATPSYEEAKRIAQSGDIEARRSLAAHEDLEPEFLYYFASDDAPEVRRAVAENTGTPLQADMLLAQDADEDVRFELARKIGRLMPNLTPEENQTLTELALQVVNVLAEDGLPRVRATVSEEIKHADNLPPILIHRLARDVEEIVAAPVLEYSPLLNDEDLLDIITSGARGQHLVAVARRRELAARVSEALTDTRQVDAVMELLRNVTAEVSEKALDQIAEVAESEPELHQPLVDRENLPSRVILRIAGFVSSALLDALIDRNRHMETEFIDELKSTMRERIAKGDLADRGEDVPWQSAEDRVRALHEAGRLGEPEVRNALDKGESAFVRHALARLAGVDMATVQKMLNTKNAKAVVALAWKADLSAELAEALQIKIARIQPRSVLSPKPDGGFPLSQSDIEWYLGPVPLSVEKGEASVAG